MAESTSAAQANHPNAPPALLHQFGRLLQASQSGHWKPVADVGDFDYTWVGENANQPWAPKGQFPDANPYAVLSLPGHQYVADAGSNTIDEVTENGSVRIIAFVPNPLLPFGPGGALGRSATLSPPAWRKDLTDFFTWNACLRREPGHRPGSTVQPVRERPWGSVR